MAQGGPQSALAVRIVDSTKDIPFHSAKRLDNSPRLLDESEVLVQVEALKVEMGAMRDLRLKHHNEETIKKVLQALVDARGKLHYPDTDSGGFLIGRVSSIGAESPSLKRGLKVGDRVVPMASLTAIPLKLDRIVSIRGDLVRVDGTAILRGVFHWAPVPASLSSSVALSCFEAAQVIPLIERLIDEAKATDPKPSILILGAGSVGLIAATVARRRSPASRLLVVDVNPSQVEGARSLGVADVVAPLDCTSVPAMVDFVRRHLNGVGASIVVNCVSVPGSEIASVLATREAGTLAFVSLETSFSKGVLGTKSLGKNIHVIMGAGARDDSDRPFAVLAEVPMLNFLFHLSAGEKIDPPSYQRESDELWRPDEKRIRNSVVVAFAKFIQTFCTDPSQGDAGISSTVHDTVQWYKALQRWSVRNVGAFWAALWNFFKIPSFRPFTEAFVPGKDFQSAQFFVGALVNHSQVMLRHSQRLRDSPAVISRFENDVQPRKVLTFGDLWKQVELVVGGLRKLGLRKGDRVVAMMPNSPENLIASLAVVAIGGIWSACSPDMGEKVILPRFEAIQPTFLFASDAYLYAGKTCSCRGAVEYLVSNLPTLKGTIAVPFLTKETTFPGVKGIIPYSELLEQGRGIPLTFEPVPASHPVYILYTSGTTGAPKCITQGFGVLLNHMKETALQCDIREGDLSFWFTNSAWMIWHWDVSVLALGASVLLFDGSPAYPKPGSLLEILSQEGVDHFGTSGRFLATWAQQNVSSKGLPLPRLRLITTSGSPLSPTAARHVYAAIKQDVLLASVSGGTELNGCLAISSPVLPVYPGELQCAPLGLDTVVLNADATEAATGAEGELACLNPFPSQPLFFWGDQDGKKYHEAYFAEMKGIWVHGDFATRTSRGGFIIHGRSDVTLKPGGVRLGTGDYYEIIAGFGSEIEDSVVVGRVDSEGAEHVILFVKMVPGKTLTPQLIQKLKETIKTKLSPRHVPSEVVAVGGVPVNVNNKKLEKMVKLVINGKKVDDFSSIANPDSIRDYQAYAKRVASQAKL